MNYRQPDDAHARRDAADDAAEVATFRAEVASRRRAALHVIAIVCGVIAVILVFLAARFGVAVLRALTGGSRPRR